MKKFIIMSLAVFALALVACQSDKQKCENEGKVWMAEEQKCISNEQKECEEKEGMAWNEEENKCEEKSDEQANQDEQDEQDEQKDQLFTILFESKKRNSTHILVVADLGGSKTVSLVNPGECVTVKDSKFENLKISTGGLDLCDNDDDTTDIAPCSPGNYSVLYHNRPPIGSVPSGYSLTKKEKAPKCTVKGTIK